MVSQNHLFLLSSAVCYYWVTCYTLIPHTTKSKIIAFLFLDFLLFVQFEVLIIWRLFLRELFSIQLIQGHFYTSLCNRKSNGMRKIFCRSKEIRQPATSKNKAAAKIQNIFMKFSIICCYHTWSKTCVSYKYLERSYLVTVTKVKDSKAVQCLGNDVCVMQGKVKWVIAWLQDQGLLVVGKSLLSIWAAPSDVGSTMCFLGERSRGSKQPESGNQRRGRLLSV